MSFDWVNYLRLAEELATEASSSTLGEAMWRAAISRAYYAAFISARNFLRDDENFVPLNRRDIHYEVRTEFDYSGNRVRQKIATNLGRLHIWRKRADYEDAFPGSPEHTASFLLKQADEVLVKLQQL